MDFREMTYITTVADCGSITAAARKLYISQPSLSYIVSKVEQDVGVKLFERKNYPLTLTYAGEKYVETARKILALSGNLRRELMDIGGGEKGRISVGIPTERAGYMLPEALKRFRQQFPGIEVRLYEANSDNLLELLGKDEINFYIIPRSRAELPDRLKEGSSHVVNLGKLREEQFILLKKGHAIRKKADSLLKRHRISPEHIMEVSSCISAVQLADAGLGVTIVPERAVEVLGGPDRFCCYQYTDEPDGWDVNAVYKEDAYLDRAERHLIDLLKEVFGGDRRANAALADDKGSRGMI